MSDISSPSFLTPTTLKNITQILESEECMKSIQTFEETGDANKAIAAAGEVEKKPELQKSTVSSTTLRTRSGNTYFNLDSKSWQGGITTVGTPTELIASVIGKFKSEETNFEEEDQSSDEENNSSDSLNGRFLPESVVQTNIRQQKKQNQVQPIQRTMITRSLSNMSNSESGKKSTKTYFSDENKRVAVARKTSVRGRKVSKYNLEDEALSPEERERLRIRRQRNKEAAARCRKRRVDQTTDLQEEVDKWIAKKRIMEEEIGALQREKEELEFILTQHCQGGLCARGGVRRSGMVVPAQIVVRRSSTATNNPIQQQMRQTQKMNVFQRPQQIIVQQNHQNPTIVAVKSEPTVIVEPVNQPYILPEQVQIPPTLKVQSNPVQSVLSIAKSTPNNTMTQPLQRPASLGLAKVTMVQLPQQQNNKLSEHGISIDTPSSIVPSLNFDTFTSTGLTPTATPVSGFSFPITSASTPGTLNTPMTNTATIGGRCSTQQRSSEVSIGSVPDINSPEGISLVSL